MANKKISIQLMFSSDTSQAKAQLKELQNQLANIASKPLNIQGGISDEISKASNAAIELNTYLQKATNQQTGKLDFSKFNDSLKNSGKTLSQYADELKAIGPEGQQAFNQVISAIVQSEVPLKRTSGLVTKLWDQFKGVARYQLQSSIVQGLTSAISGAYDYAQDLNQSLNNIRIVTGQNVEQMAKFAEQANRAAKELSTTTTEYTNASLIYYQQGLDDAAVKQRTDVTIKLANVTGESAEEVSNQMTAVWNNFDDGSKSLEYYADVLTALGAATASSTSEITAGLEKFASVAETVGLSYEYATSALATVTAETRQSSEVVGTAFKTLFARIQNVKLGETLDDGTTFGKYSEALYKVGINIKDTNGNIKDMDTLLDEMGEKWQTLAKDQQIALAETVAGTRQYTQLVALMDNWDKFQTNLNTANTSSGALQDQADIYAESWEAAKDRVTASLEQIYKSLISDDFFIGLLDNISKIIDGVDKLIDSMGGLKGVLAMVSSIALKLFSKQMSEGLSNMAYTLKMNMPGAQQRVQDQKNKIIEDSIADLQGGGFATIEEETRQKAMIQQFEIQQKMLSLSEKMSQEEKQILQIQIEKLKIQQQQSSELAKEWSYAQEEYEKLTESEDEGLRKFVNALNVRDGVNGKVKFKEAIKTASRIQFAKNSGKKDYEDGFKKDFTSKFSDFADLFNPDTGELNNIDEKMIANIRKIFDISEEDLPNEKVEELFTSFVKLTKAEDNFESKGKNVKDTSEDIEKGFGAVTQKGLSLSDAIVMAGQAITSIISIGSMFNSMVDILNDPDLTSWEKFSSIMTSLVMIVGQFVSIYGTVSKLIEDVNLKTAKETTIKALNAATTWLQQKAEKSLVDTKKESNEETDESIRNTSKETVVKATEAVVKNGASQAAKAGEESKAAATGVATLGQSFSALGAAILPILPEIIAIVAIIGALGAAVYMGIKQYNAAADAAKEASESNNKLAESYENARDSYQNFVDTIQTYKDLRSNIDNLTKGTLEYKEAVLEANEQALQLIKTLRLTSGDYTIDLEGLIKIDEKALLNKQTEQLQYLEQQQNAQIYAQMRQTKTEANLDYTNFYRKYTKTNGVDSDEEGYKIAFDDIMKQLQVSYEKNGNAIFTDFEKYVTIDKSNQFMYNTVLKQLKNSEDALEKQIIATAESNKKVDMYNKQFVSQTEVGQKAGNNEQLLELIDISIQKEAKKTGVSGDDAEIQKRYAELMGWDINNISNNTGTGTYYDLNGNVVAEELSDVFVREYLAKIDAAGEINENFDQYAELIKNLQASAVGNALANSIGQKTMDFSGLKLEELGSIPKEMNKWSFKQDKANFLGQYFGLDKDQNGNYNIEEVTDTVKQLGFDTIEAYIEAIEKERGRATEAFSDLQSDIQSIPGFDYSDLFNNASLQTLQQVKQMYEQVFKEIGEDGVDSLTNALSQIPSDKIDEAVSILNNIDWTQNDAPQQLQEQLNAIGITIDSSSGPWSKYIEYMQDAAINANNFIDKLNDLRSEIASLNEIIDKIDFGTVISDDQYNELISNNKELADSFIMTAEGWKFIGQKEQLQGLVDDTAKSVEQIQEEFLKAQDAGNKLQKYWDSENGISSFVNVDLAKEAGTDTNGEISYNNVSSTQSIAQIKKLYGEIENLSEYTEASKDQFNEWINILDSDATIEQKEEALKRLQSVFESVANFQEKYNNGLYDTVHVEELLLSTNAKTTKDLKKLLAEGKISLKTYNTALDSVIQTELKAKDIDFEEFKNLRENLKKTYPELEKSESLLSDVALQQVKLSHAVQDLSDNWEDYDKILKEVANGNFKDLSIEQIGQLENLKQSIADAMNVDSSVIDDQYLIDHLDLIGRLAKGDNEAFQELRQELEKKILISIGIDSTEVDNYLEQLSQLDPEVIVGTDLNDQPFLLGLANMMKQAGYAADQIQDAFNSLGVELEIDNSGVANILKPVNASAQTALEGSYGDNWRNSAGAMAGMGSLMTVEPVTGIFTGWKIKGAGKKPSSYLNPGQKTTTKSDNGTKSSSSKGSKKDEKEKKEYTGFDDAIERYKEINDVLDDLSDAYRDLSKETNRYFGVNRIQALKNETTALKDQNKALRDKQKLAKQYQAIDKANAEKFGFKVNEFGNIENYTERMGKLLDTVNSYEKGLNAAIDDYNSTIKDYNKDVEKGMESDKLSSKYDSKLEAKQLKIDTIQKTLDDANQQMQWAQEAVDQLDETNQVIEENSNSLQDNTYAIQDNNAELISYSLQMKLLIQTLKEQELDLRIGEIEVFDSIYDMAEKASLTSQKFDLKLRNISDYTTNAADLLKAYNGKFNKTTAITGEGGTTTLPTVEEFFKLTKPYDEKNSPFAKMSEDINKTAKSFKNADLSVKEYTDALGKNKNSGLENSIAQAAFAEQIQEVRDGLIETLESIQELDKAMAQYYGDTIAMANEEISKQTAHLDHLSSKLEHYKNLMDITGNLTDYTKIEEMLKSQADLVENQLNVAKAKYKMYEDQYNTIKSQYESIGDDNKDGYLYKLLERQLEEAQTAMEESYDEMLSLTENWADLMKQILENTLARAGQNLEKVLTGGDGFDQLNTKWERSQSLQEEYLTNTNKIYETTKLMRKAEQEIDKTTNSIAKKKLQAFVDETQQLQNQSKLSDYELKVQQAKYDLLVAQIALEDAKNAKSTVRLKRDSEGNYGYVYTADQNKVDEAQQGVDDAENSLYNISLEGQQGYAQKYQQTMQEMYDALAQIQQNHLNGAYESETEYQQAIDSTKSYYYEKLQQYLDLYNISVDTSASAAQESWTTELMAMTTSTKEWQTAVDGYITECTNAFNTWKGNINTVQTSVGLDFTNMKNAISNVNTEANTLSTTINDTLIPKLTSSLTKVQENTAAYGLFKDNISGAVEAAKELVTEIGNVLEKMGTGQQGTEEQDTVSDYAGKYKKLSKNMDSAANSAIALKNAIDKLQNKDITVTTTYKEIHVTENIVNNKTNNDTTNNTNTNANKNKNSDSKSKSCGCGTNCSTKCSNLCSSECAGGCGNQITRSAYGLKDGQLYDTGGYTGDWGTSEGKMAILHEKELILNKEDTENILSSVELVRSIMNSIDAQTGYSLIPSLGLTPTNLNNSYGSLLEQEVSIQANFPNVQDRNEIEEAFKSLINRASQYANRK